MHQRAQETEDVAAFQIQISPSRDRIGVAPDHAPEVVCADTLAWHGSRICGSCMHASEDHLIILMPTFKQPMPHYSICYQCGEASTN